MSLNICFWIIFEYSFFRDGFTFISREVIFFASIIFCIDRIDLWVCRFQSICLNVLLEDFFSLISILKFFVMIVWAHPSVHIFRMYSYVWSFRVVLDHYFWQFFEFVTISVPDLINLSVAPDTWKSLQDQLPLNMHHLDYLNAVISPISWLGDVPHLGKGHTKDRWCISGWSFEHFNEG